MIFFAVLFFFFVFVIGFFFGIGYYREHPIRCQYQILQYVFTAENKF
jgi:hypothetical protein